jgi:hypothetical protein
MHMLPCGLAALAVAGIFYVWRAYQGASLRHELTLRERVTYMLWVLANRLDVSASTRALGRSNYGKPI